MKGASMEWAFAPTFDKVARPHNLTDIFQTIFTLPSMRAQKASPPISPLPPAMSLLSRLLSPLSSEEERERSRLLVPLVPFGIYFESKPCRPVRQTNSSPNS